jgi:hypothetical protein
MTEQARAAKVSVGPTRWGGYGLVLGAALVLLASCSDVEVDQPALDSEETSPRVVADGAADWGREGQLCDADRGSSFRELDPGDAWVFVTSMESIGVYEPAGVSNAGEVSVALGEVVAGDPQSLPDVYWIAGNYVLPYAVDALSDDARLLVRLDDLSDGAAHISAVIGLDEAGGVGFVGDCRIRFSTPRLAEVATSFDVRSGEDLVRTIIGDPTGPEAAAFRGS